MKFNDKLNTEINIKTFLYIERLDPKIVAVCYEDMNNKKFIRYLCYENENLLERDIVNKQVNNKLEIV